MSSLIDTTQKKMIAAGIVLVVLLASIVVAAAGGDEEALEAPTTTVPPTTTTTAAPTTTTAAPKPPPTYPLTGVLHPDPANAARPALVVKIDNLEPKARPQVGINQADVVYEERVEGSVTRLLAVLHSNGSTAVGPVRSARTSDIPILSQLRRPLFAWSGANPTFAGRVRAADVADVGYDVASGLYRREPGRPRPNNLFLTDTPTVYAAPHSGGGPPIPLFKYRSPNEKVERQRKARHVRITYGTSAGSAPVDYIWNGTGWSRFQSGTHHVDVAGVQVAPKNVVIQFVDYVPSDTADQLGVPIREAQLLGRGEVWVLTKGGLVAGTWQKPNLQAPTKYLNHAGHHIELTPGTTWVALPSPGGAQVLR